MRRFFLKLFRRRNLHEDLDAELAFHREMAAANGNGIPLGNTSVLKDQALDLWRFNWLENLWRDVVYAARGLRRSPALVASALLSLGLGIGVNTAMFSLAVEFLLSQPSVTDASSLVAVRLGGNSHAKREVVEFVRDSGVFQSIAGENEESYVNWNNGVETRQIFGVVVTKNLFADLGIPVARGRGILPSDPEQVTVLTDRFWRRHYNADPEILGRAINLNNKPYTVVGILPAAHRTLLGFGFSPDLYLPQYLPDTHLAMYARLKPGMSIGEAQAAVRTVATRLDASQPERFKWANNISVTPIAGFSRLQQERQLMTIGFFFALLLAIVGLVLLVACINVASLLLARASARRREIAIRLSIGASRGRLLQQMLVESLLLAAAGAAAGLILAQLVTSLLAQIHLPLPLPIRLQLEPDWRVALYAAFLTLVAAAVSGLLPALQALRESIASHLPRDSKQRLRRALVVGQVAISVVILATGFVFIRNLMGSASISPGFDTRQTVRAEVNLPDSYKGPERVGAYIEEALRVLHAVPGIEAAAAARVIPFNDSVRQGMDVVFPDKGETVRMSFQWNAVTPEYFRAMDIPLRLGRAFAASDRGGNHVVIVNRTFVSKFLNGRQPLGTVMLWGADGKTPYEIVGVAEDTKNTTIGEDPRAQLYEPLAQIRNARTRVHLVMRSAIPPVSQLDPVRQALRRLEPAAGLEVQTLFSSIGLAFLPSQAGAALLGSMGMLGLLLAAIGLYGMMVYSVTRRTAEIGVRMAIGATRRHIVAMVLRESMTLVALGSAVGLVLAYFVTKPLTIFLVPGIRPADPRTFLSVIAVLAITGVLATWGPLRRASAVDPLVALRHE